MPRFSERHGIVPVKNKLQITTMDEQLRNGLWNALSGAYFLLIQNEYWIVPGFGHGQLNSFIQSLWADFFKLPLDTIRPDSSTLLPAFKDYFFKASWHEVYDFIEFFATNFPSAQHNAAFITKCNSVLERELSAYRFVGGYVTPVTGKAEISQIEEAVQNSPSPVRQHLRAALDLVSNRRNPDCRNSIKESISAVESLCSQLAGKKATLPEALKVLSARKKLRIHPALHAAFDKLYGYTSDADGIRHAMLDEPNLKVEDAIFMLASCSAFINYLLAKTV